MLQLKSEKELNIMRGKMMVNYTTNYEITEFLKYVSALEALVEEASNEDFYGTRGWQHRLGWED